MNNEPNKKNGAKPAVAHKKNILDAVSYTHLTLPTILRV